VPKAPHHQAITTATDQARRRIISPTTHSQSQNHHLGFSVYPFQSQSPQINSITVTTSFTEAKSPMAVPVDPSQTNNPNFTNHPNPWSLCSWHHHHSTNRGILFPPGVIPLLSELAVNCTTPPSHPPTRAPSLQAISATP
jgi:hypothetical protein